MGYPCIADTATVNLAIIDGALEADLQIAVDATNGLTLGDDGLAAASQFYSSARVTAGGIVQNVGSGSGVLMGTTRWAVGGMTVAGSALVTDVPGLWLFGGCVSFDTGVAVGTVQVQVGPVGGLPNPALDTGDSGGTSGFAETITLNPVILYELAAGVALSMTAYHTFGGTIPTVASDGVMAELFAILVKPYEVT